MEILWCCCFMHVLALIERGRDIVVIVRVEQENTDAYTRTTEDYMILEFSISCTTFPCVFFQ